MYPLDDTRIHPKQRIVNPFFRVLSHCTDYVPIFVHARQTVGYKKTSRYRFLQKNVRSPSALENARFILLLFQPLFEISLGTINGTTGIMRQNAILTVRTGVHRFVLPDLINNRSVHRPYCGRCVFPFQPVRPAHPVLPAQHRSFYARSGS